MFVPGGSLIEPVIRGSIMYLGLFILLRIFRRQAGSVSIADILLIVIIADAAQNGMAGEAKSITEAMILIGTIIFWDYSFDWVGFKSKLFEKILEPGERILIENGRFHRRNLEKEMLTEDEVMSQLRQQGVEDISEVKKFCLESNGEFSLIKNSGESNEGNKKRKKAVS